MERGRFNVGPRAIVCKSVSWCTSPQEVCYVSEGVG